MKILVTGGAGFVGSHLVDALLEAGHEVRVLDNLCQQVHGEGAKPPDYLNSGAELQVGDVRDPDAVRLALEDVEIVFHLAAAVGVGQSMYEITRYVSANSLGAAVLLEEIVARRDRIRKMLVASSMSIYGEGAYRNTRGEVVCPPLRSEADLQGRRLRNSGRCPALLQHLRNQAGALESLHGSDGDLLRAPAEPASSDDLRRWAPDS